jgi:hypothetical protein
MRARRARPGASIATQQSSPLLSLFGLRYVITNILAYLTSWLKVVKPLLSRPLESGTAVTVDSSDEQLLPTAEIVQVTTNSKYNARKSSPSNKLGKAKSLDIQMNSVRKSLLSLQLSDSGIASSSSCPSTPDSHNENSCSSSHKSTSRRSSNELIEIAPPVVATPMPNSQHQVAYNSHARSDQNYDSILLQSLNSACNSNGSEVPTEVEDTDDDEIIEKFKMFCQETNKLSDMNDSKIVIKWEKVDE